MDSTPIKRYQTLLFDTSSSESAEETSKLDGTLSISDIKTQSSVQLFFDKTPISPASTEISSPASSIEASSPSTTKVISPRERRFDKIDTSTKIRGSDKVSKFSRSLSVGRIATKHDTLFNFIPGSCFEIGASLALLRNPGDAGETVNRFSKKLADHLEKALFTELGDKMVIHKGKEKPLREIINTNILTPLQPNSDQIGRCLEKTNPELQENWKTGAGARWLVDILRTDQTSDGDTNTKNMLTKVRAIAGFGETMECAPASAEVLSEWTGVEAEDLKARYAQIKTQIDHANFNDPLTRARAERAPIVEGVSISQSTPRVLPKYVTGAGELYEKDSFHESQAELLKSYESDLAKYGRQGIRRQGEVITDTSRPGVISDYALMHMPDEFKDLDLDVEISSIRYEHGTGINRWQLKGSYPRQSWEHDLPAAGCHSGATRNVLSGANTLNDESIFGNEKIASDVGIITAAFMNFGGYHTFVETLPLAEAVAKNNTFVAEVNAERKKTLYQSFINSACASSPDISSRVLNLHKAYEKAS
jgi:hypothetical protein